ncbi:ribulose-phosphate 3-epimerase [Clostridium luticellarii]|jgi:ribulose-phosphate 3-epimerase|uniref:ribulose-phosphate 3-epimerase n=1 Tax=Clostridium luticellarii TaxID=1691940 RepID=UPI002355985F|nr:ribulose-phosphate 3-epimerase [Clostridium luticellarii]MCI1943862.1 ribulose-phosphate 3-epimerase [Clostridium luticellarii]MCI1967123.1 ribulose-phosphate 3-epimerase [Clostridium luticellarii]MCI1994490.1 ribulose-phosphate 3-epimerase [Clostridium luticellarii]MCI2038557.1 ribulose-phosphate 3-epimerase [Clostridium luticellarii]
MIKIAPSILSADFSRLGEEIKALDKYGADLVHIDVMDGNFVPNISFGVPIIKSIRRYTKLPFDVHLMIQEPARYIESFVKAGADIITVHFEADNHLDRTLSYIKSLGVKAAVALNPATLVDNIKYLISDLDMVLIMSVNPGFGGQKYIDYCSEKIREVKALSDKYNENLLIEVDGGISKHNIGSAVKNGANVIVAGSAVFRDGSIEENIKMLREGI